MNAAGRENISEFAPRFYNVQIPVDKIRDLIGPGGKIIPEHRGTNRGQDRCGRFRAGEGGVERSGVGGEGAADYWRSDGNGRGRGSFCRGKSRGWRISARLSRSFPAPIGLLHISEVAEHRIADVRDELKEGDQVLVKVLAVEGNRIRLSRKAILKEQRAKMASGGDGAAPADTGEEREAVPAPALTGSMVIEGGGDFPEDEPNFNREGAPAPGRRRSSAR